MHLKDRLKSQGPKRILALDGGGIRGILTLGILKKLETILRERHQNPNMVLCDYFDLIGGTSTGAIIASALAIGKSVDFIKEKYMALGIEVFEKNLLHKMLSFTPLRKATFDAAKLEMHLKDIFKNDEGEYLTLGSPEIKTGLCIICKRADTQSVWPLLNHPDGKFFDSDLGRNKNIKLWEAIRASTAAPTYFVPTKIEHGGLDGIKGAFVDGGVSMANNPSLQLLMVANLRGFPFRWSLGAENLLMVSVGTGYSKKKDDPDAIVKRWLKDWALEVPNMLMQDSSRQNELLLQWMSQSPTARYLDMEIEALDKDLLCGRALLTYLRYNVALDKETLADIGMGQKHDEEIASLIKMENSENCELLYKIGIASAERYLDAGQLPAIFDLHANPVIPPIRVRSGEIPDFDFGKAVKKPIPVRCIQMETDFEVETDEGLMKGKAGDYLMVGVKGEMYPCKKEVFEETYERMTQGNANDFMLPPI